MVVCKVETCDKFLMTTLGSCSANLLHINWACERGGKSQLHRIWSKYAASCVVFLCIGLTLGGIHLFYLRDCLYLCTVKKQLHRPIILHAEIFESYAGNVNYFESILFKKTLSRLKIFPTRQCCLNNEFHIEQFVKGFSVSNMLCVINKWCTYFYRKIIAPFAAFLLFIVTFSYLLSSYIKSSS